MGRSVISVSFAHLPGTCGLALSPNGRYALTGAADCAVRAHDVRSSPGDPWWARSSGSEPTLDDVPATDLHDKAITDIALAPDSKTFATASEDGFVRLFSASVRPEQVESTESMSVGSDLIQSCARFGAPVRALDFSPTGTFLAAAGDEPGTVKLVVTAHPSTVNILRSESVEAAKEPIIAIAFDPKADFISTVSSKGSAVIWSVASGTCVGPIILNNRFARCVTWSPDGSRLVLGTDSGAVLVRRDEWVFEKLLQDAGGVDDEFGDAESDDVASSSRPSTAVLAVSWSRNGRYVLTASADRAVRLWDVLTFKILSSWKAPRPVQRLSWHASSNAFVVVDEVGQFGVVGDVVPSHLPSQFQTGGQEASIDLPTIPNTPSTKRMRHRDRTDEGSDVASHSSEDMSDSNDDELGSPVRRSVKRLRGSSDRDDAGVISEESDSGSSNEGTIRVDGSDMEPEDRPDIDFDADELDADVEEDVVELRRKRQEARARAESQKGHGDLSRRHRRHKRRNRRGSTDMELSNLLRPAQPSFVPSSTPHGEHSTKKRILCWTLTAVVISYTEDTHNIVEVEFSEATRRSVGIKDHFGFQLGCVSESGVLLASPRADEQPSIVSFRPFKSWSNNSEWNQALADGESAITVALGERFAAVATDQNTVRLFSLSGIQVDTFGMAGRVVTMAASRDRLALVFAASEIGKTLRYHLLQVANNGCVSAQLANDDLVLSPRTTLEWFGFSNDTCDLVSYDSSGSVWLQVLDRCGHRWLPMLRHAAKAADCDWFWVAAATSESLIGAQCFSTERHPPAKPRPSLRTIPLCAPVVDQLSKNGQASIQERLFRSQIRLSRAQVAKSRIEDLYDSDAEEVEDAEDATNKAALDVDKCILGLMEAACRQEQNLRAFDLATRLNSMVSFKFAINLATHYKRTALAGRVEALAHRRMFVDAGSTHPPSHARPSEAGQTSPTTPRSSEPPKDRSRAKSNQKCDEDAPVGRGKADLKGATEEDDSENSDGEEALQNLLSKVGRKPATEEEPPKSQLSTLPGTKRASGPRAPGLEGPVTKLKQESFASDARSKKAVGAATSRFAKRQ